MKNMAYTKINFRNKWPFLIQSDSVARFRQHSPRTCSSTSSLIRMAIFLKLYSAAEYEFYIKTRLNLPLDNQLSVCFISIHCLTTLMFYARGIKLLLIFSQVDYSEIHNWSLCDSLVLEPDDNMMRIHWLIATYKELTLLYQKIPRILACDVTEKPESHVEYDFSVYNKRRDIRHFNCVLLIIVDFWRRRNHYHLCLL